MSTVNTAAISVPCNDNRCVRGSPSDDYIRSTCIVSAVVFQGMLCNNLALALYILPYSDEPGGIFLFKLLSTLTCGLFLW